MNRITVSVAVSATLALLMVPVFMQWTPASAAPPPTGQETIVSTGSTSAEVVDVLTAGADSEVNAKPAPRATWTKKRTVTNPSARVNHAMAYDSALGRVVLYGGFPGQGTVHYDDTWEWNGRTWTNISSGVRPPARHGPAMAYDSARSQVVLFGGTSGLADTWELDGATWTQRFPVTSPPSRFGPAMAYDSARGRVIMFGGGDGLGDLADTWEWDGVTWTQLAPATSPSTRRLAKMVYDSVRDRIVLFGGSAHVGCPGPLSYCPLGDTWEWDGSDWTQINPALSPPARSTSTLTYDSARGRVVLFGGGTNEYGYLGDTWEWDGTNWSQINPSKSPSTRGYTSSAYDAARGRTVLFGGYSGTGGCCLFDETWEYAGVAPQ